MLRFADFYADRQQINQLLYPMLCMRTMRALRVKKLTEHVTVICLSNDAHRAQNLTRWFIFFEFN